MPASSLSADTLLRLMNRVPSPPADAPAEVMREAYERRKYIDAEDGDIAASPRDCVTRIPLANEMLQLLAWDTEGQPGPFLVLPAVNARESDATWLLMRCREMRPPAKGTLRIVI